LNEPKAVMAQGLNPSCPLPFDAIKQSHPIDDFCGSEGSSSSSAAGAAQDRAKNNFCASGPTVRVDRDTFVKLQQAAHRPGHSLRWSSSRRSVRHSIEEEGAGTAPPEGVLAAPLAATGRLPTARGCDASLWNHVYHPQRLRVKRHRRQRFPLQVKDRQAVEQKMHSPRKKTSATATSSGRGARLLPSWLQLAGGDSCGAGRQPTSSGDGSQAAIAFDPEAVDASARSVTNVKEAAVLAQRHVDRCAAAAR